MTEQEQRAAVVKAASGWLGTPYHNHGRVKGAGVDCATLLIESAVAAGLVEDFDPGTYRPDWHLHRSEERYLNKMLEYCREVETPLPGDIALFQFGRCFSHGAIVVEWPTVIHSYFGIGCTLDRADTGVLSRLNNGTVRPVKFFSLWGK